MAKYLGIHLAASAAQMANEDQTDGHKTMEPPDISPESKHPLVNAYQPGAKREKLENSSSSSSHICPTDHRQDVAFTGLGATPLDEVSTSGQQTSERTQDGSGSF